VRRKDASICSPSYLFNAKVKPLALLMQLLYSTEWAVEAEAALAQAAE
jgi:hypothetical protein